MLKYLPLTISALIIAVGSFFVPWHEVIPYLQRLSLSSYLLVVSLGTAYYLVRIMRYHYMLGILKAPRSFHRTVLAYFIAQPISLLPAGETYRMHTLKKHVNVPLSKGGPVVIIQSFTENLSLVLLALASAVVLKQQVLIVIAIIVAYLFILVLLRSRRAAEKSRKIINKLPFVNFARSKFRAFITKNKILLSGKRFFVLLASGFASSVIAIILLFVLASDMDIHITLVQAVIVFTLPTVLQNISFLPGGIGVNEQGSVGILLILGISLPAAVALTLLIRLVTLGWGVVLGVICMVIKRLEEA